MVLLLRGSELPVFALEAHASLCSAVEAAAGLTSVVEEEVELWREMECL